MSRRWFGTDGIRGRVGIPPIVPDFVLKLGWAAGRVLAGGNGRILIGRDPRCSGEMLEATLAAGFMAAGFEVWSVGVLPTPAIAHLTRSLRASAGAVISASHNPYHDNGIKFFGPDGFKLPDALEEKIEVELDRPLKLCSEKNLGHLHYLEDAEGRYIEFCKSTLPRGIELRSFRIVLDCAHGAVFRIAPKLFSELGAQIVATIGCQPDGLNINHGCGATHPEALKRAVLEQGADVGIAFDGDGDRVIFVDEEGEIVDGNDVLYILASAYRELGKLKGPVVGTMMTNFGLEKRFSELAIPFLRTRVGDRYVLEALLKEDGVLGGESSGHVILLDRTTTGDGLITALAVLAEMVRQGRSLHQLKLGWHRLPQVLKNVEVREKPRNLLAIPDIAQAVRRAERLLADRGRVLLRPSGTEPVVRVMVEGEDPRLVEELATELATLVAETLE